MSAEARPGRGTARACPECESDSLTWSVIATTTGSNAVEGRLRTSDLHVLAFLDCDECSENVAVLEADEIARRLQ